MCKKLFLLVFIVLFLGSVCHAADIQWTGGGGDNLWSNPDNWDQARVPTLADEVLIDVPEAAAPNGPVIQDGIDAKAKGIFTEAAGEPTLTITGGTLEVAEWIWWGDGADSFGIWDMSGGTVTVSQEFELGWGGGAGTLTMTGGTISAGEAVIPTSSGAFGELYLYGGTYNVTNADGLSVKDNGLVDITEGTLVLEGDDTAKVNDLIAAGKITAYGGDGTLELDFDVSNPGKTTLTASAPEPVDPGTDGLLARYALDGDATDSSGNGYDGTITNADTGGLGDGGSVWVDDPERGVVMSFNGDDSTGAVVSTDIIIPALTFDNDFTWAFWCFQHPDQETNNDTILGNRYGGTQSPLQFCKFTPTRFEFYNDDGNYEQGINYDPVPGGVWIHHVISKDGADLTYYRNGIESGTNTITKTMDENPFGFGGDAINNNEKWQGYLSDVRLYNKALSAGEAMYLAGFRAEVDNLALNPSFEEDDLVLDDPDWYQWCTWNAAEGAGSNATIVDTDAVDGSKSLLVEPIGVENWHFIVANISFPMETGADFTATFWAKADADRPLAAQMKAADNSVTWGYADFQLTTEWAQYTMTSTAESDEGKLEFLCAASEVSFLLDQVAVFKAE